MLKRAFFFSLLVLATVAQAKPSRVVSKSVVKSAAPQPSVLPQTVLNSARRAFDSAQFAQAAKLYESLPNQTPEFLRSREELAWTYLRLENWGKLRGILRDLNTQLVPLRWRLEGRVLSAMLLLRDCQYEAVKNEIASFQNEMRPLAALLDKNLRSPRPSGYWAALKDEYEEAVFKMKFVRMELRSRLVMLTRAQVIEPVDARDAREKLVAGAQTYPVDGDLWSDEIFNKRGEGKSLCSSIHKKVTQ